MAQHRNPNRKRIVCVKCGKDKRDDMFYKTKSGDRYDVCKDCLTRYVDCKKPETFLWILKEFDIPFIESIWVSIAKKVYTRDPDKFTSSAVMGSYFRVMMMGDWRKHGWKDSVALTERFKEGIDKPRHTKEEAERHNAEIEKQFAEGKISEAKKKLLLWDYDEEKKSPETVSEGVERAVSDAIDDVDNKAIEKMRRSMKMEQAKRQMEFENLANKDLVTAQMTDYLRQGGGKPTVKVLQAAQVAQAKPEEAKDEKSGEKEDAARSSPPIDVRQTVLSAVPQTAMQREQNYLNELTDEDRQMLALKWGDNYTPSEWVKMEDLFRKYASEYEMNVDRKETLKKMCKTSLKMDQALDADDTMAYSKLSQVFDQLRKSAKFTEAQNKDKEEAYVDSIGELVAKVEQGGGIIPQFDYKFEATQDKVDLTLKDMKAYTYNLVKNEMGLGDIIESYIQKLEQDQKDDDDHLDFSHELKTGEEPDPDEAAAEEFSRTLEDSIASETSNIFAQLGSD